MFSLFFSFLFRLFLTITGGADSKGVGRKISRGKRLKNSKKDRKLALLSLFQGVGGNGKKDRKIAKKYQKIALLSLYLYTCTMYENPGGATAPLSPAADAHG